MLDIRPRNRQDLRSGDIPLEYGIFLGERRVGLVIAVTDSDNGQIVFI